ncbi:MAG: PDZ domain-containing protein [Calditrichaeota bacterium]|nr:trypsin-like peptidase domain-containing protein [Calditrichota bacterium]RQW07387.1 MAG: PDZ domain-containing protein [Calditrichota bacterium]
MQLLKKIIVGLVALTLISVAVYIIMISYKAQETRKEGIVSEETITPEEQQSDTLNGAVSPRDSIQPETPPATITQQETLKWKSLSESEIKSITGLYPGGNPNPVFIAAARRILPAVVTVTSEMLASAVPKDKEHQFFWDQHDFEDFFQEGTGSGIIISANGYVLTNNHVVQNGTNFTITLYDKREFPGKFIGGDPNTDIALLKIEGDNLPAAYIGNSDSIQIGEWVMAVGSPLNFTSTITAGIVSALGRNIRIIDSEYGVENFIQTDAVINPGNSGGALININGEVVGVNTAIATRTGLYQGYGFAIPINLAIKIVNDIRTYGEVRRGLLGVSISNVDNRVAKGVGLPKPTGVLVQGVQPGKSADEAGIKAGDVILSVNGNEVVSVNDLQIKIASKNPGELVDVQIWRDGRKISYSVKLGKAPVSRNSNGQSARKKTFENLGMEIRDLTNLEKNSLNLDNGIYIQDVKPGSPASVAGIFSRYVLYSMNGEFIRNQVDFEERLGKFNSGEVIKIIGRPTTFRSSLDDRIFFVEIP